MEILDHIDLHTAMQDRFEILLSRRLARYPPYLQRSYQFLREDVIRLDTGDAETVQGRSAAFVLSAIAVLNISGLNATDPRWGKLHDRAGRLLTRFVWYFVQGQIARIWISTSPPPDENDV